ncbi:MAG: hypothetical protein KJP25_10110 [Gammaproteobacteria bacterium]|nr:hypothetical protein [Gammaproteobacteria bacterium]NND39713.1 hypothetical protein [Pseudomonadales bacterium]MBT8151510.1 hypothetical protein [Gammaproteobacteria bacterium]NNL10295.1 hypothetical protein [Pseudomonadales bacterium]NNM12610.1 hypothetical protein [Pseudomonadales bacterium]
MNKVVEALDRERGRLRNRRSGWVIGEGVFAHGHNYTGDFFREKTFLHALILNATGRMPEDRFCTWVGACHLCMSWPDPRIWCNTVASLAASARTSPMTATIAALAASQSSLYGTITLVGGIEFIEAALRARKAGESIEQILPALAQRVKGRWHIPGYLRPIADGDERITLMLELAESLGYEHGEHLQLALEIERYLLETDGQSMNFAGYASAFLADNGISVQEGQQIFAAVVSSGATACYAEDIAKPAGHFLPLRCSDIEYSGPARRELPGHYGASREKK